MTVPHDDHVRAWKLATVAGFDVACACAATIKRNVYEYARRQYRQALEAQGFYKKH